MKNTKREARLNHGATRLERHAVDRASYCRKFRSMPLRQSDTAMSLRKPPRLRSRGGDGQGLGYSRPFNTSCKGLRPLRTSQTLGAFCKGPSASTRRPHRIRPQPNFEKERHTRAEKPLVVISHASPNSD